MATKKSNRIPKPEIKIKFSNSRGVVLAVTILALISNLDFRFDFSDSLGVVLATEFLTYFLNRKIKSNFLTQP